MTATFYVGDALEVMATLPAKSVDLVLSSPPFLALRSYLPADHPLKTLEGGSQATPGAYIDWLVDVVEACDRILAPHGSLCFELGDTYAGSGGAGGDYNADGLREGQPKFKQTSGWHRGTREGREEGAAYRKEGTVDTSLQNGGRGWPLPKSLSLIPELFRLTLVYGVNPLTGRQTERWRLRNVIRWVRPNPPVGALGDKFRPATSELMVFCKSAKRFFDLDAVRGELADPHGEQRFRINEKHQQPDRLDDHKRLGDYQHGMSGGAPPLDWWNIPPGGYQGAHYAVWPPELCVKPIKTMSPEKVCRQCGEPSRRITDVTFTHDASHANGKFIGESYGENAPAKVQPGPQGMAHGRATKNVKTLGFSDCSCKGCTTHYRELGFCVGNCTDRDPNHWRPGLILDPFVGSGTTLAVATGHGRDAIGIDLDERNYALALERVGPLILQRGEVAA